MVDTDNQLIVDASDDCETALASSAEEVQAPAATLATQNDDFPPSPLERRKTLPVAAHGFGGLAGITSLKKHLLSQDAGIKFMTLADCETSTLGQAVHYKGFAARIDFQDSDTKLEAERVLDMMNANRFDTLVWDGDSFSTDSFTKLIPDIYHATNVLLVMFLRDTAEERDRVEKSWNPLKLPIVCFLCSPDINFEELGAVGLKATGSRMVVCFGGGAVVDEEVKHGSRDVSYHFFGASRRSAADPQVSERSPMEKHVLSLPTDEAKGSAVRSGLVGRQPRKSVPDDVLSRYRTTQ